MKKTMCAFGLIALFATSAFAQTMSLSTETKQKICNYLITDVRDYAETKKELNQCMKVCMQGLFAGRNGFAGTSVRFQGQLTPGGAVESCSLLLVNGGQPAAGNCD